MIFYFLKPMPFYFIPRKLTVDSCTYELPHLKKSSYIGVIATYINNKRIKDFGAISIYMLCMQRRNIIKLYPYSYLLYYRIIQLTLNLFLHIHTDDVSLRRISASSTGLNKIPPTEWDT